MQVGERKRERDEPDAPLLLEREHAAGEVDVVIGRKQGHQADHDAGEASTAAGPSNANFHTALGTPRRSLQ